MIDGLPDLELIKSTHTFPGPYTFKAIGTTDEHFIGRVIAAVKSQLDADAEPSFSTNATKSGKHVSVTVEPELESAEQVHDIYRQLQGVEGLFMLL
ncbi:YbeD family protein [Planctomicrobium sp. SH668]|uniref:YbeD family protein n=1 Tax=Planctomicrobium sp. SH668 TaxID=3448126 RepID=UPI003F5AFC8F